MSRVRAGVYFIPQNGRFYDDGSALVGYDIRSGRLTSQPQFIRRQNTAVCEEYGFHVTITDAIEYEESQLPELANRLRAVLRCFRADNAYVLTKGSVGFWRDGSNQAALRFTPNRYIELLHDVLVTALHPLGVGSEYFGQYRADPQHFMSSDVQRAKTQLFYSPYIFEEFLPHFTCVNPYDGTADQRKRLELQLEDYFGYVDQLAMDSVCLVAKPPEGSHYRILEEFQLHP